MFITVEEQQTWDAHCTLVEKYICLDGISMFNNIQAQS